MNWIDYLIYDPAGRMGAMALPILGFVAFPFLPTGVNTGVIALTTIWGSAYVELVIQRLSLQDYPFIRWASVERIFSFIAWMCAILALILLPFCALHEPDKLAPVSQALAYIIVYGALVLVAPRILVRRYLC